MSKNIYVGNLPHATTDEELKERFSEFGEVESASIIMDKFTGKSRGFGFVKMEAEAADAAIAALDGQDFGGRTMKVSEARSRESRGGPRSGGGGGFGGNRGGSGGGFGGSRGGSGGGRDRNSGGGGWGSRY